MDEVPLGMPADEVLKKWGKGKKSIDLGKDKQGVVVGWEYPWGLLVFKRRKRKGVTCYRVVEKRAK